MANPVFFVDIGADGAVAVHPQRLELPALVAPVPEEKKGQAFNTIREPLVAIGCMRLPSHAFEFDSSFISPNAEARLAKFAKLMDLLRDQDPRVARDFPPISLFGHADPVGTDVYNANLAGRRALAVYGLLTRDTALWDRLFKGFQGDQWGRGAVRLMLSVNLRRAPDGTPEPPFFVGPAVPAPAEKAAVEKQTDEAIKAYKAARPELGAKAPVNATLDGPTRKLLFAEYMDAICHFDDAGRTPFKLDPRKHFIARAQDAKTFKGDVQGCGEFNPVLLMSKAEDELFAAKAEFKQARDAVNASNRRVLAFIFRHGTVIDPAKWPCPVASDGSFKADVGACRARFWSDGEKRLGFGEDRRQFGKQMPLAEPDDAGNFEVDDKGRVVLRDVLETGNTMACRFYHGFAAYSPCEAGSREWVVRFRVDALATDNRPGGFVPLANKRFVLQMGESAESAVVRGTLDDKGEIRIPVLDRHVLMTIKLDALASLADPPADGSAPADPNELVDGRFPGEENFMPLVLDAGALKAVRGPGDEEDLASRQRLYNLGFGPPEPAKWDRERDLVPAARAYRAARQLPADAPLRDALVEEHDLRDATPVEPDEDQPPT